MFKFKNKAKVEKIIISVLMSAEDRNEFINGFHRGDKKIKYNGAEATVTKIHPTHPDDKGIVKLTIKP